MGNRYTNNRFISEDEYVNRYLRHGVPYEGFVLWQGYAYFRYESIFPVTSNVNRERFWDRFPFSYYVQCIDSSDYMKERSLNLKPDDIYKQLVLENPDGTLTVRMGKDYEVIAEQCEINIEDNGSEVNVYVSVKSIKSENGKDTDTLFSQRYCRLKDFRHVFDSRLIPAYYNGNEIASVGDTDNWWANVLTTMQMFYEWSLGVGPSDRTFKNDRVANAFRNAPEVKEAREFFYKKYAGVNDLAGAYVSNYTGNFGLKGLFKAGLDPIEQFVGSYRIDINVIDGIMLEFTLTNTTSMKSLLYGIGPDWERSSFRPSGNITQIYIFTEPIR